MSSDTTFDYIKAEVLAQIISLSQSVFLDSQPDENGDAPTNVPNQNVDFNKLSSDVQNATNASQIASLVQKSGLDSYGQSSITDLVNGDAIEYDGWTAADPGGKKAIAGMPANFMGGKWEAYRSDSDKATLAAAPTYAQMNQGMAGVGGPATGTSSGSGTTTITHNTSNAPTPGLQDDPSHTNGLTGAALAQDMQAHPDKYTQAQKDQMAASLAVLHQLELLRLTLPTLINRWLRAWLAKVPTNLCLALT